MSKTTYIVSALLLMVFSLAAQSPKADSLKAVLSKNSADTNRVNALNDLGGELFALSKNEETIAWATEALELGEKLKFQKGIAMAYHRLGNAYYGMGRLNEALPLHLKSLKLKEELKDQKGIAATCQNIGNVYSGLTDLANATHYYLRSLKIKEELGDKKGIANSLHSLGNTYKDRKKYAEALDHYEQALKIRGELNLQQEIAQSYASIGILYGILKDFSKTIAYTEKSLAIYEKLRNPAGISACLNSLGTTYRYLKDYTKALEYHKKGLELHEQLGDKYSMVQDYTNMGNAYFLQGNPDKAILFINRGLELAKEVGSKDEIRGDYYNLSFIYERTGKPEQALKYYKLYAAMQDSILNIESSKQITEATTLYKTEKKEKELVLLKKEQEIQKTLAQAESKKQLVIIVAISAILLLVIVFLIYAFLAYRTKEKANQVLSEQKQLIEKKNSENENLLAEIHHRVKNNLQVVSSLLSLQGKSIGDSEARTAIEEGKQRVRSMELVHKMLYEGDSFSGIRMKEYIGKLVSQLAQVFGIEPEKLEVEIRAGDIKLDIDTAVPVAIILNELITNSFKYAYTKTKVLCLVIEIEEEAGELKLQVADNGYGVKKELIVASPSFGLKLVQLLTKQLNGSMTISADTGLAYTFLFGQYKLIR